MTEEGDLAELQEGWDRHDAAIADRSFAADVAWGSPCGATVDNFDRLVAIHQQLKQQGHGWPTLPVSHRPRPARQRHRHRGARGAAGARP